MAKLYDAYFQLLKFLIALCLAIMVVLVFGNVVLRYAFNSGITQSEELSRWLFVWLTFLGAIVALKERAHLGVDSFVLMLPPLGRRICLAIVHVLMLGCIWLFLTGSWEQTLINLDVAAPATGLSTGWFYGAGVVFSASAAVVLSYDLFRIVTGRLSPDELVMVVESEEEADLRRVQDDLAARDRLDDRLPGRAS